MIYHCPVCGAPTEYGVVRRAITCSKVEFKNIYTEINWKNHFIWFVEDDDDQLFINFDGSNNSYWGSIEIDGFRISGCQMDGIPYEFMTFEEFIAEITMMHSSRIFI
jgi:hypothetical protein